MSSPLSVKGYAAFSADSPLAPYTFERRSLLPNDVLIEIFYCGICHTDIHQTRNEWGGSVYPMVPGHEIVGRVQQTGPGVRGFHVGDPVGVGCFVDTDRTCPQCRRGLEPYCDGVVWTYNSLGRDGRRTHGGYSSHIVVDENYVHPLPASLPLDRAAPLLCAGITTYSPLRHWKVGPHQRVAVVGLGGLGHMAVQFAVALGAEVTVVSTSPSKKSDAKRLGAAHFRLSTDGSFFAQEKGSYHFILDTVSARHDVNAYLSLLGWGGAMVMVGVPPDPVPLDPDLLIMKRRTLAGSLIGGLAETREMLKFCADHKILPEVEIIPVARLSEAYDRMVKSDVRFRFVLDLKTL